MVIVVAAEIKKFSWCLLNAILSECFMTENDVRLSKAIFAGFGIDWGEA